MIDFDERVMNKFQTSVIVNALMENEDKWKCEKGHVDPYALEVLIEDALNLDNL